jgi:hypothetical protein
MQMPGDRNAGQGEDRVDIVELQCIDEKVKPIDRFHGVPDSGCCLF